MLRICILATVLAMPTAALAQNDDMARTAAPEGAEVFFVGPQDGATVSSPVTFNFGLSGMGVAPAGVDWSDTGHHHLFVNVDPTTVDLDQSLPATENILHFGGGQTQVTLELPEGTHSFWLVLGDHNHVPHDPPIISEPITLTIE